MDSYAVRLDVAMRDHLSSPGERTNVSPAGFTRLEYLDGHVRLSAVTGQASGALGPSASPSQPFSGAFRGEGSPRQQVPAHRSKNS
jgi:hypothetical protein